MDRNAVRSVAVAAAGVLALALAAATLPSTLSPDAGSGRGVSGSGGGFVGTGPGGILPGERAPAGLDLSVPLFLELLAAIGFLALLVALVRYLSLGDVAAILAFAAVAVAGLVAVAAVLPPLPVPDPLRGFAPAGTRVNGTILGGAGGGGPDEAVEPSAPPLPVLALVTLGFLGTVLALVRGRGSAPTEADPGSGEESSPAAEVGRIAGRAADRIEDAAAADDRVDNEVYRAWLEMARSLDVDAPEATTPGEFAAAAAAAGLPSDDVSELTRLFEDVRYGGQEPTAERERRAVAVLRRIEPARGDGDR